MIHTNTEITGNIVNAALDAGVRKMVHISSVASLGRDGTGREITEEAQWEESGLNSAYALSKYGAEMEAWRGIGEGLDAVILNPGIILGEPLTQIGWKDGSARLMLTAWKEFPFFTDGITAFVDIRDVVRAALALMHSEVSGERFILSAGNFPFRDIFNLMADALGRRRPHIHAGAFATGLVWRWSALKAKFGGSKPLITKETARNAQAKSIYKADKIFGALPGFTYTPIEKTIADMAKVFLAGRLA
jgi:nucleoside-diphosphate-sugar epimerase